MTRTVIVCLTIAGCAAPVSDGGCLAYGAQRATMPPLAMAPVDAWVAVLDTAMTAACR